MATVTDNRNGTLTVTFEVVEREVFDNMTDGVTWIEDLITHRLARQTVPLLEKVDRTQLRDLLRTRPSRSS